MAAQFFGMPLHKANQGCGKTIWTGATCHAGLGLFLVWTMLACHLL